MGNDSKTNDSDVNETDVNPFVNGFVTLLIQVGRDFDDGPAVKQTRNAETGGVSSRFRGRFPSVYFNGSENVSLGRSEDFTYLTFALYEEGEASVIEAEQFYEVTVHFDPYKMDAGSGMVKNRKTGKMEKREYNAKRDFNMKIVAIEDVDRPAYWPAAGGVDIPLQAGSLAKAKLEDIPTKQERDAANADVETEEQESTANR